MVSSRSKTVQKVLDLIAEKQLMGEKLPELSNDRIEAIADSIIFEWNEAYEGFGYPEEFDNVVKWNLEQNILHWNG